MDTSTLLAKTHVAASVVQQMKVRDEAEVHVPGVADPVPAKVSLISPALDPGSTTIEVWLNIDNKAGKLKVGTPVKASVTGKTVDKAEDPGLRRLTAQDGTGRNAGRLWGCASEPVTSAFDGDDLQSAAFPPPIWSSLA
jgi:hypothetical protein